LTTSEQVNDFFKKVINLMKQMNYAEFESDDFKKYEQELDEMMTVTEA
jgi:V/A-type H+-transporting ATPase subunit A